MELTARTQSKPVIKTPDQRLRVFVSSTLQELAEERAAVRRAIQRLRLTPVMFELGARPHAPKDLYRAYLEQSHIFIGIYYQSYGWVAPTETISGLEDEFSLSHHMPRLIYVKRPAPEMQEGLKKMLTQIHNDSYRHFANAEELEELVTNDLAMLLSERFETPAQKEADLPEMVYQLPIPPNHLIGRKQEIEMVKEWFHSDEKRLVTLLGSGGVGKTRLSIAIADELKNDFPDGVCFITFDKITDPAMMASIIADKLGLSGNRNMVEAVKYFLTEKKLLLVLDNLEHLLPGAGLFISGLLQTDTGIKVLATSRIPLEITGEQELRLNPFEIPKGSSKLEAAQQLEAVQLFCERVNSIKPGFKIDNSNLEDVLAICRRLDGLPLALELAAARMRIFTPKQLAQKLQASLDLLKDGPRDLPDRQRTLRSVVEWSYNLLTARQKEVFYNLSAFVGGVSYDAAERVCKDDTGDLMDTLLSLAAHNLVRLKEEASSEIRFAMFDTIREFALEKLRASGKELEVHVQHALFYSEWVPPVYIQIEKDPQHTTQLLQEELGNIRLALQTLIQHYNEPNVPKGAAAALISDMIIFWDQMGLHDEALGWFTKALEPHLEVPPHIKVKSLWGASTLNSLQGNFELGEKLGREALTIALELKDTLLIANSQRNLGKMLTEQNKYVEALALLDESMKVYRQLDDKVSMARTYHALGNIYMRQARVKDAKEVYLEDLRLSKEFGNRLTIATASLSLGTAVEKQGNYSEAKKYYIEAIELMKKFGDIRGLARGVHNLGNIHFHECNFAEAKRLYLETLAAKEKTGDKPGIATSLGNLGWVAFIEGSFDEAKNFHKRSIELKRKMGYTRGVAISLQGLALVTLYQGDYTGAYYQLHEAIGLAKQSDDKTIVAGSLEVWALLTEKQKDYTRSAMLLGAADAIRKSCNAPAFPNDKRRNDDLERRLRKIYGEKEFEDAFKLGAGLSYESSISFAMESKL